MKKKEFLEDIFKSVLGRTAEVKSVGCGQNYFLSWYEGGEKKYLTVWVDVLGGGRISLKVKGVESGALASRVATALYSAVYWSDKNYIVDAATKADYYRNREDGSWVARLRMDKVW